MHLPRWPVAAACLAISILATLGLTAPAGAQTYEPEELEVLRLINEYRQQNGLEPLLLSDPLSRAAEHHSEDMGRYGFFSHITQASSYYPVGADHTVRAAQEGYDYNTGTAENLAYGQPTAEAVFEAWRTSPNHNANMLGDYRVIGIGLVWVGGTPYWTTVFGGYVDPSAAPAGQDRTTAPARRPDAAQTANAAPRQEPAAAPAGLARGTGERTPKEQSNPSAPQKEEQPAPARVRTPSSAAATQYAEESGADRQPEPAAREAQAQYDDPSRQQKNAPPAPERGGDTPGSQSAGGSSEGASSGDDGSPEGGEAPDPTSGGSGDAGGSTLGIRVLPDTGGPGAGALAAGLLLVAAGLIRLRSGSPGGS